MSAAPGPTKVVVYCAAPDALFTNGCSGSPDRAMYSLKIYHGGQEVAGTAFLPGPRPSFAMYPATVQRPADGKWKEFKYALAILDEGCCSGDGRVIIGHNTITPNFVSNLAYEHAHREVKDVLKGESGDAVVKGAMMRFVVEALEGNFRAQDHPDAQDDE
jgi:hypothetical protein